MSSASELPKLLRLLRVHSWYYLLGIPLLAVLHHPEPNRPVGLLVEIFAFSVAYFCWGYVFNNLFDLDEDDEPRNSFKSMRWRWALTITLSLQLLLIAASIGLGLGRETLAVILLNTLYSVPPWRSKRLLLPSLFSNGVFFSFPYYASVRLLKGALEPTDVYFALFVFALFLPLQYIHALEHREQQGKASGFGHRAAAGLLFGMLCLAAAFPPAGLHSGLVLGTVTYSVVCLGMLFTIESARRARVAVKFVSMAFGLYLAVASQVG